tara:strand:+ start:2281 stop:3042 length:762 start_codon:yes stop_codon:yes gene_type:complete
MSDQLSKKYLLYLRDMSRKVVYGSSAAGNYSQVLIRGSKLQKDKRLQRVTNFKIQNLAKNINWYKQSINQEKIGNGIFCASGVLTGSYTKKSGSKNLLKLISAPLIYSQITFEEDNEYEISEWVINYDLASTLFSQKLNEEEEAFSEIQLNVSNNGSEIIDALEEKLSKTEITDLKAINEISSLFIKHIKDTQDIEVEYFENPLLCCEEAIKFKEIKKEQGLFCTQGDWIFFAPIPPGLSTYRALNDLAEELK